MIHGAGENRNAKPPLSRRGKGVKKGANMPYVTVKAVEGRTIEQKRGLVKDITEAVVKNFNVKPEAVSIDILEYSKENLAKAGELFSDR